MNVTKIIMFPKIQPDTTIALFLLREFGEEKLPGVKNADVAFWTSVPHEQSPEKLKQDGVLLLDMGGGMFDHHNKVENGKKTCLSWIVSEYLGVKDNLAIKKLLDFAYRDDVEGKGTVSSDTLDRAFGFSGLLMGLNRDYPNEPKKILDIVWPLIESHFHEEHRRHHQLPAEYKELQTNKKVMEKSIQHSNRAIKAIFLESNNVAMPGYLRGSKDIQADVVAQQLDSGHVNIITRQWKKIELRNLIIVLRVDEMRRRGIDLKTINWELVGRPGFFDKAPQWYYDTAATSIQNGGVNPQNIEPTIIPWEEFPNLVELGLDPDKFAQMIRKQ